MLRCIWQALNSFSIHVTYTRGVGYPADARSVGDRDSHPSCCELLFIMYCCRKVIKDDLDRNRRSSLKCVKTPAISRTPPGFPDVTPVSGRLSLPSASVTSVKSITSSTVKSQSSLPVCADRFFQDNDSDYSRSFWSGAEFDSFDVSNMEQHDVPSTLSSSKVERSHEVSPACVSTCSVQRSPVPTLQCQPSNVMTQSVSRDTSDTCLMSWRPNTTSVSSLPALDTAHQKVPSSSSAAAKTTASSLPSGVWHTHFAGITFYIFFCKHSFSGSTKGLIF